MYIIFVYCIFVFIRCYIYVNNLKWCLISEVLHIRNMRGYTLYIRNIRGYILKMMSHIWEVMY